MTPTPTHVPDPEVWEALRHLADRARLADLAGNDLLCGHLHMQINHLLSQCEAEHDPEHIRLTKPAVA